MGLSDELTTLQDLHEKGKLTDQEFAAAKAATLEKHGSPLAASAPVTSAKPGFKWGFSRLALLLALLFIAWVFMRQNFGNKATNQIVATVIHTPIEVKNEVENLPASSWKAVSLNLPYSGTVDVNLEVVRGNPVDVFVTASDQLEATKKGQWSQVRAYADFNATKTKTYRRSTQLGQGAYYLVLRDTSLGILSSSTSDVRHPNFSLGIPVYSDDATQHDYIVQARDAFDQTILGLHQLARHGIETEIRVVLHRLSVPRLTHLAEYICRNLTFVDHVAFMGMEHIGYAPRNMEELWIDPVDYQDQLENSIEILARFGIEARIYNLQLCVLRRGLWKYSKQAISDWKNSYSEPCNECAVRERCGGFFQWTTKVHSRGIHALTAD